MECGALAPLWYLDTHSYQSGAKAPHSKETPDTLGGKSGGELAREDEAQGASQGGLFAQG